MNDNLKMIVYMARHDPAVICGFLLLAVAGLLLFRIQLKISRSGRPYMLFRGIDASLEYFKIRKQYGWSVWPAIYFWLIFPLGVATLVFGLFRL
jgi:hypothetical protein